MARSAATCVVRGCVALTLCAAFSAPRLARGQAETPKGLSDIRAKVGLGAVGAGVPEIALRVSADGPASAFLVLENVSDHPINKLKIMDSLVPENGALGSAVKVSIGALGAKPAADGWSIAPHKSFRSP